MALFSDTSLRRSLTLAMLLTGLIPILLISAGLLVYEFYTFRQILVDELMTQASIVGSNCNAALAFQNGQDAEQTLSSLAAQPSIIGAAVFTRNDSLLASYVRSGETFSPASRSHGDFYVFSARSIDVYRPIMLHDERVGTIFIRSDLNIMYDRLSSYAKIVLLVIIASMLAGLAAAARFQRRITAPILDLVHTTEKISATRDYALRAPKSDIRELGTLAEAYNEMLLQIERHAQLLDLAPVLVRDLGDRIILWNSGMEHIYGYTRDEAIGRESHMLFKTEFPAPVENIQREFRESGRWEGELIHHGKDGSVIRIFSRWVLFYDADGVPAAVLEVNTDITGRKAAEEALRKTLAELARSNKELEQFAYVASHDLQEPLRMVSSFTQLLERRYGTALDGDAKKFIHYAVDGANRMQILINDLLTYSRVGSRKRPAEPVNVNDALDQAMFNLSARLRESNAEVTRDALPSVLIDRSLLVQLFQNLVGNAIKFHGADPPRVHVGCSETTDLWTFSVRDNGIGIEKEFFDRIFVVFQRLHGREDYPGTGIGLAVCKRIVESHGGAIWLESAPGRGTTFYFTVPKIFKGNDNDSRG